MFNRLKGLGPLVLLLATLLPCASAAPLRLCYEDAPQAPWTMPDNTGLNVELLRRVGQLTGERFEYFARPWKRCVEETRAGVMDGMMGPTDSPWRRAFSVPPRKPDGSQDPERALYHDHVTVYLRTGSGASWDGRNLANPSGIVLAQRSYQTVDLLRAQGYHVLDSAKSAEDGLRMLAAGIADVAVLMGRSAEDMVRSDPRFVGRIELAAEPYAMFDFHLIIARKVYDKEPARIEAIWNAIAKVRTTPEYQHLEAGQLAKMH